MRSLRFTLVFLSLPAGFAFSQQTGASDYALGGSSVMWSPGPASLFLNPAELARLRQSDFGFNAWKFTKLSSFSSAVFIPSAGIFGGGASQHDSSSQYSFVYALPIGRFHSLGLGLSGFRKTEESIGFSLGTSFHFPENIENSGFHFAGSVIGLSENTSSSFFSVNLGAAYWIVNNELRVQLAYQHASAKDYVLLGIEVLALPWMSVQLGTRSFKEISGGLSFRFDYGSVDIAAGKLGMILSVRAALSGPATEVRDDYIALGEDAVDEERFSEALGYFRKAVDYDPYFTQAETTGDTIEAALKSRTDTALVQAADLMQKKDFVEATKAYSRILRMDPENEIARENLNNVQPTMRGYIHQLVVAGDSLRNKREIDLARRSYEQAQELDPENDSLDVRIASLEVMAKSGVQSLLSRAKNHLNRNQLDDAQKEYEQVLVTEPRNNQALRGLETIRSKRRDIEVEKGKELFALENYMDALAVFLRVLEQDERHREAKSYVDRTRRILQPMVDNYFRSGLQYYTRENYKAALEEWEKGLLISPEHQGTLEYKKRADEKLKALERLK